jgi:general secretion pathway protein A
MSSHSAANFMVDPRDAKMIFSIYGLINLILFITRYLKLKGIKRVYLDYYSLTRHPFSISPDPRFLRIGEKHTEALSTLKYGIMDNKGFLLLTGEIGTGKTVLIKSLVKQIDAEVTLAVISDPRLQPINFYNILAYEFGMDSRFESKADFLIFF